MRIVTALFFILFSSAVYADGCVSGTGCAETPKSKAYSFMDAGGARFLQAGVGIPLKHGFALELGLASQRLGSADGSSTSSETVTTKGKWKRPSSTTYTTTNVYQGSDYGIGPTIRVVYSRFFSGPWYGFGGVGVDIMDIDSPDPDHQRTKWLGYALGGVGYLMTPGWAVRGTVKSRDGGELSAGVVHFF